jgi:hypothetical protein
MKLILGDRNGFLSFIETDFKLPSRMGGSWIRTLLERVGRSSLGHLLAILRALKDCALTTAMTSLRSVELPNALRDRFEAYQKLTGGVGPEHSGLKGDSCLRPNLSGRDVSAYHRPTLRFVGNKFCGRWTNHRYATANIGERDFVPTLQGCVDFLVELATFRQECSGRPGRSGNSSYSLDDYPQLVSRRASVVQYRRCQCAQLAGADMCLR